MPCPFGTALSNILLGNNWRTKEELAKMSPEDKRNTVIVELSKATSHTIKDLQGRKNTDNLGSLTAIANMVAILKNYNIRSSGALKRMKYEPHIRNTLIVEIKKRFSIDVKTLQARTDNGLLKTFCTRA